MSEHSHVEGSLHSIPREAWGHRRCHILGLTRSGARELKYLRSSPGHDTSVSLTKGCPAGREA